MQYVKRIEKLTIDYCNKIVDFLKNNEIEAIEFINPIAVFIDNKESESFASIIPCVIQFIDADGVVGGIDNNNEPIDWKLSEMSIEELAYILDTINTQSYYEYSEDECVENEIEAISE